MNKLHKLSLILIITVILAILLYSLFISLLVNPYIQHHTWKLIDNNCNVYEQQTVNNTNAVYFIGNSMVMSDINTTQIEKKLLEHNLTYDVYNLGVNFDTPLQRLIELPKIVESKPEIIIIGNSFCCFSNQSVYVPDDNLALLSNRIEIDDYSKSLFSDEQISLIDMNEFDRIIFKRKFIIPAIRSLVGIRIGGRTTFVNESLTYKEKILIAKNPYDAFLAPVFPEDNVQKQSFRYFVSEIEKAGIPILYVNMPLDPMRSETIPNSTRINYFNFLNSTGIDYIDMEYGYRMEEFSDLVHFNKYGNSRFSDRISDIIMEMVN